MNRNLVFGLVAVFFILGAGWFGYGVQRDTRNYRAVKDAYAEKMNYKQRLTDFAEWFGEDDRVEEKGQDAEVVKVEMGRNLRSAHLQAGLWVLWAALFLVFSRWYTRKFADSGWFKMGLLLVALACLFPGLTAPMLEISAYENDLKIPIKIKTSFFSLDIDKTQVFDGEMYFYYQSKSVIELIGLLFRQQNWVVGVSILLFSVVIPTGKTSLLLWSIVARKTPRNRALKWLMLKAGKWSMADVFVAGVFLAFLAFNNMQTGIATQSSILPGMYFFLAYVVLSVSVSGLETKFADPSLVVP